MNNPDPTSQHKYLVRHFFGRFFDLEAISSPQIDSIEKNTLIFQFLAMMVLPGVVCCLLMFNKYGSLIYRPAIERDLASLTDKCLLLSLSMMLIGFLAVFEWDMLFPDRKDYQILTPMPVTTRGIFLSKCAALAAFLLAFTAAIDLCPTFLFPIAVLSNNSFAYRVLGKTVPTSLIARYIISHAMSMLLANIFVFFSAISLKGIILALTPPRLAPAISSWARFFCLVLLLGFLFSLPGISSVDQLIHTANPIMAYYPPLWFVGVYEILLGSHDAVMWGLGERAILALILAGALSILTYAMCYRRFMRRSIESGGGVLRSAAAIRRAGNFILDNWFLKKAIDRASYHFVAQTIFRSPRHILHIGTYLAVGLSIAAMGLADQFAIGNLDRAILSVPLILSFFLLVGMRVIFALPVDLDSNWLFRLAPIAKAGSTHAGVRKFLIFAIIVPIYVLTGLFYLTFWSWDVAVLHVCYGVTLSLLLMQLLFCRFPKIPFTCSYIPGAARSIFLYPFYFFGFATFAYAAANLEAWLARSPHRFLCFYGLTAALVFLLIRRTADPVLRLLKAFDFGDEGKIRFEERSEVAPVYLDLKN
jgi:hypothetical protein